MRLICRDAAILWTLVYASRYRHCAQCGDSKIAPLCCIDFSDAAAHAVTLTSKHRSRRHVSDAQAWVNWHGGKIMPACQSDAYAHNYV